MEETFSTKTIILDRQAFREKDSRVVVYTRDRGKFSLVARGTKTIKSKLAGHIEPFNAVDIMVVKGKTYNYLAGASTVSAFLVIKSDIDRLELAGKGFRIFNELVRAGVSDANLFDLLYGFLSELNKKNLSFPTLQFIYSSYLIKLYSYLGYSPILDRCTRCAKVAVGSSFLFDYKKGGVVCTPCTHNNHHTIKLSLEIKKLLQFISASFPVEFVYPPLHEAQLREFVTVIEMFTKYHKPI